MLLIGVPQRGPDGKPWPVSKALDGLARGIVPTAEEVTARIAARNRKIAAAKKQLAEEGETYYSVPRTTSPSNALEATRTRLREYRLRSASSEEEWWTAIHEAGHAVAAHFAGLTCGQVSVVPEHNGHAISLGHTAVAIERLKPAAAAMVVVAGDMAKHKARTGRIEFGGISGSDQTRFVAIANKHGRQAVDRGVADAKWLLSKYWPAIDELARELVVDRTLSGARVTALCKKHIK